MRKLSLLEVICLGITVIILGFMGIRMAMRQNLAQDTASSESDNDTPSAAAKFQPGSATADGASEADSDAGFSERARLIPNPLAATNKSLSTDTAAVASVLSPEATTIPPLKPQMVGTNEIMLALERVASMPWSPEAEKLLQSTMAKWATTDPLAALQYALKIESRRVRSTLVGSIFTSWAQADANGAYNWLLTNRESDPGTFAMGLRPVFSSLAASGVDNAMKMALAIPSSYDRMSAIRVVADQASRGGTIPSMTSYLDSFQTPSERQGYASMLAQSWAIYAPQDAAQWAMSLTDPALRQTTLSSAVGSWASDNPQAAAEWAMTLPQGDLKNSEIAQITQSWARYDPVNAADWLLSMHPPSPNLDPAIRNLVNTVVNSNPEGAVMWANTISDPKMRNNAIVNASRQWLKTDPQKASAYIVTAPISPAQRAMLLKRR